MDPLKGERGVIKSCSELNNYNNNNKLKVFKGTGVKALVNNPRASD